MGVSGIRHQVGSARLPDELVAAFRDAPEALMAFETLPVTYRDEFVRWVREGKRAAARERRAAQAVMRLLEQQAAQAGARV